MLRLALAALLLLAASDAFARGGGCGSRGGPGYRGPDGRCVGWDRLARVCGSPPTLRCTAEGVDDDADDQAGKQQKLIDERNRKRRAKPES